MNRKNAFGELTSDVIEIARDAGKILMRHYNTPRTGDGALAVEIKADKSPVTAADKESSALIVARLQALTPGITVISEENKEAAPGSDGLYWTVDPLDGTKGFISRNDHFYVKIALIENGRPVLGVIHEPVYDRFYYSVKGGAAYRLTEEAGHEVITASTLGQGQSLRAVFNSLHYNTQTYDAARDSLRARGLDVPPIEQAKGMCKTAFYMAVATGEADMFVNCGTKPDLVNGNGYSWDYAPDCLILWNAGGAMVDLSTGRLPRFDDPRKRMNAMVGLSDRKLGTTAFPELKKDCL